jgi:glycerol-3-phosphate dehydrogenase subunit C
MASLSGPTSETRPGGLSGDLISTKKVAYFTGCFADYYYPEVGEATMAVMKRNGIEIVVPDQVCCGLPMMAKGNRKDAFRNMKQNAEELARLVADGYSVITTCSSCGLFLKRDSPHFIDTAEAHLISDHLYHFSEYLLKLHEMGELDTRFRRVDQTVFYHTPCHMRVQQIGHPSAKLLELIPGTVVKHISELCCGQSGAYGYEKKNYKLSREIAAGLFEEIKQHPADRIVDDCGGCRLQIQSGTNTPVDHPVIVLREGYGG